MWPSSPPCFKMEGLAVYSFRFRVTGLLLLASTVIATNITDCLTSHSVPYAVNSSTNWEYLQKPYNLRLSYQPAVITLPKTCQQVSDSVTCAAAAGLKVQAKGGGHSYASFSSGGQDGSLIVDMENFNQITMDQSLFHFPEIQC